jgi:MFS family permease
MSSDKTGNQAMGVSYFLTPAMFAFMALWIAETVSLVGSGMTCFANSVYVYTDMGGSVTNMVLLAVIAQIPGILISPFAGVLVDRWDRRWVMIIGNSVSAFATLILRLLVVSASFKLWQMYVLVMIISSANHFQWPAYFSTVPLMVPKERLGSANGLVQMGRSIGALAAPIMAGIAVSRFKFQGVILFDMLTYIFALGVIAFVKIPKIPVMQSSLKGQFSFWRETFHGWQYVIARPGLFSLLIYFGICNFLYTSGNCLIIPLGLSFISPKLLGSFLSLGGLAMIVGGIVMSIWGGPKRKVYGIIGFTIVQAVAFMFEGLRFYTPAIVMGFLLFCFAESFISACSGTIWHKKIPLEMQGRVAAVIGMVTTGTLELGYASSGLLADHVFIPMLSVDGPWASSLGPIFGTGITSAFCLMFTVFGLLSLCLALAGFAYKPFRFLEDRLGESSEDRSILKTVQVKMCPVVSSSGGGSN